MFKNLDKSVAVLCSILFAFSLASAVFFLPDTAIWVSSLGVPPAVALSMVAVAYTLPFLAGIVVMWMAEISDITVAYKARVGNAYLDARNNIQEEYILARDRARKFLVCATVAVCLVMLVACCYFAQTVAGRASSSIRAGVMASHCDRA